MVTSESTGVGRRDLRVGEGGELVLLEADSAARISCVIGGLFIMRAAIASCASGKAVNTVAYHAQSLQNDMANILYYALPHIFLDAEACCNKSCLLYDILDQLFKDTSTIRILR